MYNRGMKFFLFLLFLTCRAVPMETGVSDLTIISVNPPKYFGIYVHDDQGYSWEIHVSKYCQSYQRIEVGEVLGGVRWTDYRIQELSTTRIDRRFDTKVIHGMLCNK